MDQLEIIIFGISIVITLLVTFGAWPAIKRFVIHFAEAIEDDVFTKEEFIRQINDGIGIIAIFKSLNPFK